MAPSGLGAAILSETASLVVGLTATLVLLYFLLSSGIFLRKLVTVLPRFGDKKHAVEIAQPGAVGHLPLSVHDHSHQYRARHRRGRRALRAGHAESGAVGN